MAGIKCQWLSKSYILFHSRVNRAWYDPTCKVQFKSARALVCLGKKYKIPHLCEKALFRIRAVFPDKVENWDPNLHRNDKYPPLEIYSHDAIGVIHLARTYNIPDIDIHLCGYNAELKALADYRYTIFSDPEHPVGLNKVS